MREFRLNCWQPRVDKNIIVDSNVRNMTFQVGEQVLLNMSPMKGVTRLGKIGMLSLHYFGPFEVLEGVRQESYK